MQIKLPYGDGFLTAELPDNTAILEPAQAEYNKELSQEELIEQALNEPIGSLGLAELVQKRSQEKAQSSSEALRVTIISSDHTRPVPSKLTMPFLLREIRKANPKAEITILVATGFHRGSTDEELRAKYGSEIFENERIVNHDCTNSPMVELGTLPSGGKLVLNELAINTDLLIAEGFIEPHFFAGYSGGRKSVLPGIASRVTVLANHCSEFIDNKKARAGITEGNPIHRDMIFAAQEAKLAFILNVVLDEDKKVIAAFAGDPFKAHEKGAAFVDTFSQVRPVFSDIVITSNGGYPLDQNIYQAVKSVSAADASCNPGGVIIVASECRDGHGGEVMYQSFKEASSVEEVHQKIMDTPATQTVPDQWQTQFYSDIMKRNTLIMISDPKNKEIIEDMYMLYAANLDEALKLAYDRKPGAQVTVIPNGISVIVK